MSNQINLGGGVNNPQQNPSPDNTQNAQSGVWKRATPAEMAFWFIAELDVTPRWRVLKRMHLKRNIKFWTEGI